MAVGASSKDLYIPLQTIYGRQNKDGSYTLTALDIKNLNDNLYAIAKKVQGGLTFSDLTSAAGSEISDMSGNISTLQQTAEGLTARVESAEGNITTAQQTADGAVITAQNAAGQAASVALTVNGLGVTTSGGTTYITGDHVKSGTIEGAILDSDNGSIETVIGNGQIRFKPSGSYIVEGKLMYDAENGYMLFAADIPGTPLKLRAAGNMSIDAGGTLYIGSSLTASGDVYIGKPNGGRIDLYGDVYINGVAYGS